jgi:hypothetical protein
VAGTRSTQIALALALTLLASGCEEKPKPPSPAAEPTAAPVAEPAASQPSPDGPVMAEVNGRRVEGFAGRYSRGILKLYTGEDPDNDYGEAISFWGLPEKPSGQLISYPAREGVVRGDRMTYAKHDPSVNLSTQWLKDMRYELKLGEERDYKVSVTILSAEATDPVALKVRGTVVARTAGIEMKDGVIDPSFDHLDTIQWITREWIREHHEVKSMSEGPDACFAERQSKKTVDPAARLVAGCSYRFEGPQGKIEIAKVWLEKLDGSWKVVSELEPSKLLRAHPIKPPLDRAPYLFEGIAALRFEKDIYRPAGGSKRVREPVLFMCGGGQVGEQPGYCEIPFARSKRDRELSAQEATNCHFVTYLLNKDSKGAWEITKALGSEQRYNPFTQKVEPRALPESCADE